MKQRRNTLYCILVLIGAGCLQAFAEPFAKGPYLGQTPPGSTAQVFAPDESFMVFYSTRPGARGGTPTDLYLTLRRADGTWSKPRNMGPKINSRYYEIGARISPDKKYLFFIRSNGWDPRIDSTHSYIYWVELKEYLTAAKAPAGGAVK